MLAQTIRILEEADFQPRQARALAEAIDGEIRAAEIVTVPVLDNRLDKRMAAIDAKFFEVKLEIAQLEARLTNRMLGFGFAAVGLVVTSVFFIVQHFKG